MSSAIVKTMKHTIKSMICSAVPNIHMNAPMIGAAGISRRTP